MLTKKLLPLLTKFGTLILAGYIAWIGWQHLGPRKPEIGPVRNNLANKAAGEIAETLRQNREEVYDVVLLHFVNDPTDYFTDSLRREIEQRGIFDLRDRTFLEKLRNKLNLRHPTCDSSDAGAKIAELKNTQGALIGTVKSFESYPGGSQIEVVYELVSKDGTIAYAGQYAKESSDFFLKPEVMQKSVRSIAWFQRGLAWLVLVLLLPVFTISFIRTMARRRSNKSNAFVLTIYTIIDAILAWFLVGAALSGFLTIFFFIVAVIVALLYNIRIMTFAVKLEEV